MMPHNPVKLLIPALLLLGLVGCSSTPKFGSGAAPVSSVDKTSTGSYSAVEYFGTDTGIAQEGGVPEGEEFEEDNGYAQAEGGSADSRTVYFDYDSSEVRADHRDTVIVHGRLLALNSNLQVTIEGHCDERGSREYNIALGERRANTVKRLLMAQGALEGQVVTISYGEERPAVLGSNDQAWSRNRRAELIY